MRWRGKPSLSVHRRRTESFYMQREVVLRCLLEQDEPDSWFAICLDLNVYARAGNAGQARACLHREIASYLEQAYTSDRENFADLVPRRAPLRFWARFYLAVLQDRIGGPKSANAEGFRETVPLVPAHG